MSQILIEDGVWVNLADAIERLLLSYDTSVKCSRLEDRMLTDVTFALGSPDRSNAAALRAAIRRWIRWLRVANAQSYAAAYPGKAAGVSGPLPWRRSRRLFWAAAFKACQKVSYNIGGAQPCIQKERSVAALDALIFLFAKTDLSELRET